MRHSARHVEDYRTPDVTPCGVTTGHHGRDTRADSANWGGNMKRQVTGALLATGIALAISAATVMPAAAATSGSETIRGTIVTSGVSGTRTVISSVIVAKGVFTGVGRIVEVPSLPTDPPNVSRDDLVFPEGTMHLVSTTVGASFTVNPVCLANATLQQTAEIIGGTGQFAAAAGSFSATVSGPALLARNPDGSCSFTQPALHEEDMFTDSGTLSF